MNYRSLSKLGTSNCTPPFIVDLWATMPGAFMAMASETSIAGSLIFKQGLDELMAEKVVPRQLAQGRDPHDAFARDAYEISKRMGWVKQWREPPTPRSSRLPTG